MNKIDMLPELSKNGSTDTDGTPEVAGSKKRRTRAPSIPKMGDVDMGGKDKKRGGFGRFIKAPRMPGR